MNEQKKKPIGILLTVILISALLTVCLELGLGYLRPDTPGSIPKHLIHFAIMFLLLGGATLLCLFCPPFKKLWAWLDKNIMAQETRPIAIDIIYAVIAGLMLLHHFYVILYYPTIPSGASKLAPIWIVFAALTIILGKSWKNISFRLAAIFLIYTFERLYFKHLCITGNNVVYFALAIYSLIICLSVFSILRPSIQKPFLQTICTLWTIATLAFSMVGLYTAWTGIQISNLAQSLTLVEEGRLWIFASATITAGYLGCGAIVAFIGFAIFKYKPVKISFLLAILVMLIANSLTDARASYIMLAFIIAGTLCIGLWTIYRNRKTANPSGKKTALVAISLLICFGLCFLLTIEGQRHLATTFVNTRDSKSMIISEAKAEETATDESTSLPPDFKQRIVWVSSNTNLRRILIARYAIWQTSFQNIQNHPEILLYGLSIDGSVSSITEREDHSHNILFQTLLEGGIPALFLYLSLIFYGIFHTFRLWNRPDVPYWQRMLPLPMFSILLWEMAECLTHFSYGHPPMTLFWFFLGTTITVSKSLGKAKNYNNIPTKTTAIETGE